MRNLVFGPDELFANQKSEFSSKRWERTFGFGTRCWEGLRILLTVGLRGLLLKRMASNYRDHWKGRRQSFRRLGLELLDEAEKICGLLRKVGPLKDQFGGKLKGFGWMAF